MQDFINSFFCCPFSGEGRGMYVITQKNRAEARFFRPFYLIFISLGLCLLFFLNISLNIPFFKDASAVAGSALSGI